MTQGIPLLCSKSSNKSPIRIKSKKVLLQELIADIPRGGVPAKINHGLLESPGLYIKNLTVK
jgi:hypothetical protein